MKYEEIIKAVSESVTEWNPGRWRWPINESGPWPDVTYRRRGAILIDGIEGLARFSHDEVFSHLAKYRGQRFAVGERGHLLWMRAPLGGISWTADKVLEWTPEDPTPDEVKANMAAEDILLAAVVLGSHARKRAATMLNRITEEVASFSGLIPLDPALRAAALRDIPDVQPTKEKESK